MFRAGGHIMSGKFFAESPEENLETGGREGFKFKWAGGSGCRGKVVAYHVDDV